MNEKKEDTIEYSYFLSAFIDVLGQKESFLENGCYVDTIEENLRNPEKIKEKLSKAYIQTHQTVLILREQFKDFFKEYTNTERELSVEIPKDKTELFKEMRKAHVDLRYFSDCILASCTLRPEKYYSTIINSIYGVLMACGGLLLLSLSMKKPFRAGIDIGLGIKLEEAEVYGPSLFRAYELESKVAQYPRIVVGNDLINFLMNLSHKCPQLKSQSVLDIEWCKKIADDCCKMIVKDVDGIFILDYLGPGLINGLKSDLGEEDFKKIFSDAKDYVEKEYTRYQKIKNQKLALRYYMLRNYFNTRSMNI